MWATTPNVGSSRTLASVAACSPKPQSRRHRPRRPPYATRQPQVQSISSSRGGAGAAAGGGGSETFATLVSNQQKAGVRRRHMLAMLPPCACAVCTGSAAAQPAGRNAAMDRLFAASMATGMAEYEASIAPLKRRLFAELLTALDTPAVAKPAQLLELGVGTGPNLGFYSEFYGIQPAAQPPSSGGSGGGSTVNPPEPADQPSELPPLSITGVDPNPFMKEYLQQSLGASGWPAQRFSWVQGRAEALPLPDASCDAVVCTLVLCSVEQVEPVLDEVARVLKPGGSLLFIEHTTARFQAQPLVWAGQRALEPLQRWLADNCHLTRDPLPLIEAHPAFQGGVTAQRLSVDGVSLIAPHVAGLARKSGGGAAAAGRGDGQAGEEQDWAGAGRQATTA